MQSDDSPSCALPGEGGDSKTKLLERLIADYVIPERREQWFRTPLPAFQGRSPQQMIDAGGMDEIIAELWRLEQGMPL